MILEPGTFRVSDYRKPITEKVVKEVMKRYRRDHRPALTNRPYDTEAGDFIPPQLDPNHIDLIETAEHDRRSFGRRPGAAKTGSTRGSDVGERARSIRIRDSEILRKATAAVKNGNVKLARELTETIKLKRTLRPKRKIASRPFPKGRGFPKREKRQA